MLGIVVSRADKASAHIGEQLREVAEWTVETDDDRPDAEGGGEVWRADGVELREFEPIHIDLDGVAAAFDDPDLLAFASRHAGETGPLLTAHHTGNFGPAEFGGEDGQFARACPNAHKRVIEALETHAPDDYEVGMECTHHGPSDLDVPSMFVEVGSDDPQWDDPAAAEADARAILDLREVAADAPAENGSRRHLVGLGGGHYVPRFTRIVRETDWAVGHIGADWALEDMGDPAENRDVLDRAMAASAADYAVVEGERPDLRAAVADLGYRVVSETWVQQTTGVPLSLVERIEDELGAVADGVRFGEPAQGFDGGEDFDVVLADLPAELTTEAVGIDPEAARAAVEERAVAFETSENGTRLGARMALERPGDRREVVAGLAAVLETKYESVDIEDDAVVAHEHAFDPQKAKTLGISEGPAFGKLSSGQAVEVGGERIDPEVVHVDRTHRYPL